MLVVPSAPLGLGLTRGDRAMALALALPVQTGYGDVSLPLDAIEVLFFFFITLEPRLEWFKGLCALNVNPTRNRFIFLWSSLLVPLSGSLAVLKVFGSNSSILE